MAATTDNTVSTEISENTTYADDIITATLPMTVNQILVTTSLKAETTSQDDTTMLSTETSSIIPESRVTTQAPGSGSVPVVGIVVAVILVLILAIVAVVIVLCWRRKKQKAKQEPRARKKSNTRAPSRDTVRNAEGGKSRPPLQIKIDSPESDDEYSDRNVTNEHSDRTFQDIQNQIRNEPAVTEDKQPRKASFWDLPDISQKHRNFPKTKKSKKAPASGISEEISHPERIDKDTGLKIYRIELPTDSGSANNSRKNSIQNMFGGRKKSYTMNLNERNDSLFQLPDLSHLVRSKKKGPGKSKSKPQKRTSAIGEEDETVTDLSTKPATKQFLDISHDRKASNPYAHANTNMSQPGVFEEEYTALESTMNHGDIQEDTIGEIEGDTDERVSTVGTNPTDHLDDETGRYSVEYANFSPSRPTSSSSVNGTVKTVANSEPDGQNTKFLDDTVEYVNAKGLARHHSNEPTSGVVESDNSPSEGLNDTDEAKTVKRTSSVYVNLPETSSHEMLTDNETVSTTGKKSGDIDAGHSYSQSKDNKRASSIYLNIPDRADVGTTDIGELPVRKVEYPEDYIHSQTHRPSGPYVNIPEPNEQTGQTYSQEGIFKRYS